MALQLSIVGGAPKYKKYQYLQNDYKRFMDLLMFKSHYKTE